MFMFAVSLLSCGTSKKVSGNVDYRELARAAIRLGFDIDEDDDWSLMTEASSWLGVPYRYGGDDRRGVDCSGLTYNIYRKVYGINLSRSSSEQYKKDVRRVSKNELNSGDLVFFSTDKGKKVTHVGIYLKDSKFIHASSSKGVVINNLEQNYYKRNFVSGGKVK